MGNRLAKPPPPGYPIVPMGSFGPMGPISSGRSRPPRLPRPFPPITPESYLPGTGGGGLFPGMFPPAGMEPPIMNFSGGSGILPPPMPFAPMFPMASALPAMPMMMPQQTPYQPVCQPCCRRRSPRVCRRRGGRRSRHCRPFLRISESASCSSLSSCSSISSCSPPRHRSRSHSRRRCGSSQPPQQQQQPIILLPIQSASAAPAPNPMQQQQPQQIILPPIVQQPGQYQSQQFQPQQYQSQQFQPQQLPLPPISGQIQQQQLALPPISIQQSGGQFQQQPLTMSPIQINPCNLIPSGSSNPVIQSGQPMLQPSLSYPQISTIGQTQQFQAAPVQYVQALPQSSSPLQYVSAEPRSTIAPQRVLVNSTNNKTSSTAKPVARTISTRDVPQNDLKYGRRPFDWYNNDKKKKILNENLQIGQRGSTSVN